jgi:hypothetical protein
MSVIKLQQVKQGNRNDVFLIRECAECDSRMFHIISYNGGPENLECSNCRTVYEGTVFTTSGDK